MFVDASVLSAMMTDEEEARNFAARLQAETTRMTSPLAAAQAAIEVAARLGLPAADAGDAVRTFLELMNIQLLAIPPRAAFLAIETHGRYGEGSPSGGSQPQRLHDLCLRLAITAKPYSSGVKASLKPISKRPKSPVITVSGYGQPDRGRL